MCHSQNNAWSSIYRRGTLRVCDKGAGSAVTPVFLKYNHEFVWVFKDNRRVAHKAGNAYDFAAPVHKGALRHDDALGAKY